MRRRKTRDVGDKRVDKKGMESKINCSRHLVVTGKVITCAAFSSPATYPCRIPFVVSQLFSRSYLLPLDTGHGEGSLEYGTNLAFDGEEPFDEGGKNNRGGKLSGRDFTENKIRFATMCLSWEGRGCLFAKITMGEKDGKINPFSLSYTIFNSLFWLGCFPFLLLSTKEIFNRNLLLLDLFQI